MGEAGAAHLAAGPVLQAAVLPGPMVVDPVARREHFPGNGDRAALIPALCRDELDVDSRRRP
jgi:hypothetical protein